MNFARVVSLPLTWSASGLWGGKRPSTATLRIMLPGVLSKMEALRAPVHRIDAWTILWWSSWVESPSPSASAMRCMKSSARCRSWTARVLCSSLASDSALSLNRERQRPATTTRKHAMRMKVMEGPRHGAGTERGLNRRP